MNVETTATIIQHEGYGVTSIISMSIVSPATYIRGEEHPALVAAWDNEEDAVYDEPSVDEP